MILKETFELSIKLLLQRSLYNQYDKNNYDELRFGTLKSISLIQKLKDLVKKVLKYNKARTIELKMKELEPYLDQFESIWSHLNQNDKNLLLHIVAYRLLGYKKIVLPRNNPEYWNALEKAETLVSGNEHYDPKFLHFTLRKFDLKSIGYDVQLFFSSLGIAIDFIIEQYAYRHGQTVAVEKGDIVLDIGGCWGDTALYFAHKTGSEGKVFTFEFIPENIKLYNINTALNEKLSPRMTLVPRPVSNVSDVNIYYKDFGPASNIAFKPFSGQTGSASTITIDDFISINQITKVDFIKMDIEGAELLALEGAVNTIRKYKPKLAIAIYHSMDDMVKIPNWILNLNLDYEIFLEHFTIHSEETIIFAKAKTL